MSSGDWWLRPLEKHRLNGLNGPEPARLAYNVLDGDPRVTPIGFVLDRGPADRDGNRPEVGQGGRPALADLIEEKADG